jgi:hypothetical protein
MLTARTAMMPRVSAIEREVPVRGRSYAPAFLGWLCAMRHSFARDERCVSCTLAPGWLCLGYGNLCHWIATLV